MIHFEAADYGIIVLFFVFILFIGFRTKAGKSPAEYFVASRGVTLPAFVATLVSTFYGGILGVGEFTYKFGISGWFFYAFPYYFFILVFALFLAGKIRKTQLFTIPDKLEITYGKKTAAFGAFLIFILITPAPYVYMTGILFSMIFGINLHIAMLISLIISVIFLVKGGLKSDINVNIFEFILMFAGFGIILPFCFAKIGGLEFLMNSLPLSHITVPIADNPGYFFAWFFMGAWALVDPSFHQRCYAAKSDKTARNGVLLSIVFWFIFDSMTTIAGLYAFIHIKSIENPSMSYPLLADSILPQIAKGIFFTGILATIMSTLHSYVFISATTLGRDIICRLRNFRDDENKFTKAGIVITSIVSFLIPIFVPSVVEIWYIIGSVTIPGLLLSVLPSYFGKNFKPQRTQRNTDEDFIIIEPHRTQRDTEGNLNISKPQNTLREVEITQSLTEGSQNSKEEFLIMNKKDKHIFSETEIFYSMIASFSASIIWVFYRFIDIEPFYPGVIAGLLTIFIFKLINKIYN